MTPRKLHASRRDFLQSVVVGSSLAAAVPASAGAPAQALQRTPPAHHPLEQALRRYGSEFGGMTHIRPGE